MKIWNHFFAVAGITLFLASASAQNPRYSSRVEFFKEKAPAASPATPVAIAKLSQISTKPWLYPNRRVDKELSVAANAELKDLAADTYNSKKAVRGEGGVEFELAPLK